MLRPVSTVGPRRKHDAGSPPSTGRPGSQTSASGTFAARGVSRSLQDWPGCGWATVDGVASAAVVVGCRRAVDGGRCRVGARPSSRPARDASPRSARSGSVRAPAPDPEIVVVVPAVDDRRRGRGRAGDGRRRRAGATVVVVVGIGVAHGSVGLRPVGSAARRSGRPCSSAFVAVLHARQVDDDRVALPLHLGLGDAEAVDAVADDVDRGVERGGRCPRPGTARSRCRPAGRGRARAGCRRAASQANVPTMTTTVEMSRSLPAHGSARPPSRPRPGRRSSRRVGRCRALADGAARDPDHRAGRDLELGGRRRRGATIRPKMPLVVMTSSPSSK